MTSIIFDKLNNDLSDEVVFVERKGSGHPDTLADNLAEHLSAKYSKYCLENFGVILHHNFDKLCLLGGSSSVKFGEGFMTSPIKVLVNGRVSTKFGSTIIEYETLLSRWIRDFFEGRLANFRVNEDIKIIFNISNQSSPGKTDKEKDTNPRNHWFQPRDAGDLPELKSLFSNDTSIGVGYSPRPIVERIVLKIESSLNTRYKIDNRWIGSDIKILAYGNNESINITMCIPQIASEVKIPEEYIKNIENAKKYILSLISEEGIKNVDISINTRDNPQTGEFYLTATGSAIESGDEGVVGRGNRINKIINHTRPMSMEGASGKNPVYHIGKLYYILAEKVSEEIYNKLNIPNQIFIASQSGRYLLDPWVVVVKVSASYLNNKDIIEIINKNIGAITDITGDLVNERIIIS